MPTSRFLLAGHWYALFRAKRYAYTETTEEARRIAGDPPGLHVFVKPPAMLWPNRPDAYRNYRCPVYLERFMKVSMNARKAFSVRANTVLQWFLGVGASG